MTLSDNCKRIWLKTNFQNVPFYTSSINSGGPRQGVGEGEGETIRYKEG